MSSHSQKIFTFNAISQLKIVNSDIAKISATVRSNDLYDESGRRGAQVKRRRKPGRSLIAAATPQADSRAGVRDDVDGERSDVLPVHDVGERKGARVSKVVVLFALKNRRTAGF